jgi:hypothetical protein
VAYGSTAADRDAGDGFGAGCSVVVGVVVGGPVVAVWTGTVEARVSRLLLLALAAVVSAPTLQQDHWIREGYVELVPAVRLPTNKDGDDRIAVWLKLPSGGVIDVDDHGLVFPVFTRADRVESFVVDGVRTVVDVRGATLLPGGKQRLHVYVPEGLTPGGPLRGFQWQSDDDDAARPATAALARFLATTPQLQAGGHQATAPSRQKLVDTYVESNRCLDCHERGRPPSLRDDVSPRRPTDSQGWFVPLAVLEDTQPLDQHRERDKNVGPFVDADCPASARDARRETDGEGAARWSCPRGAPQVTFDSAAAEDAGDAHAERVCASRRFLYDHLTKRGKARYRAAFQACGIHDRR